MINLTKKEQEARYLFGELSEEEQSKVEERYFSDTNYFESLLRLEEQLVDDYTYTKARATKSKSRYKSILNQIESLPDANFAKEWINEIFAAKPLSNKEEQTLVITTSALESSESACAVPTVADFYEAKLRKAELSIKKQEIELLLKQAWENRELMSALMEASWLGFQILMSLKSIAPIKASDLVTAVGVPIDSLIPVLFRLARFGAIEEEQGLFSLSEKGAELIENLEIATMSNPL